MIIIIIHKLQAGREGRPKHGKWKKEEGRVGSTNKEKLKKKNFQMLKPKLRKKQKRSFRDKQVYFNKYLIFKYIFSSFFLILDRVTRFVDKR